VVLRYRIIISDNFKDYLNGGIRSSPLIIRLFQRLTFAIPLDCLYCWGLALPGPREVLSRRFDDFSRSTGVAIDYGVIVIAIG